MSTPAAVAAAETIAFGELFKVVKPGDLEPGQTYVMFRTSGRTDEANRGYAVKLKGIFQGLGPDGWPTFTALRVPYTIHRNRQQARRWRPNPLSVKIPGRFSINPGNRGRPMTRDYRNLYAWPADLTDEQVNGHAGEGAADWKKWSDREFYVNPNPEKWIFGASKVDTFDRAIPTLPPELVNSIRRILYEPASGTSGGSKRRRRGGRDDVKDDEEEISPEGLDPEIPEGLKDVYKPTTKKEEILDAFAAQIDPQDEDNKEKGGRRRKTRRRPKRRARKTRHNRV